MFEDVLHSSVEEFGPAMPMARGPTVDFAPTPLTLNESRDGSRGRPRNLTEWFAYGSDPDVRSLSNLRINHPS